MIASREIVSVLMPVFNVERYVSQAVNSITNQTWRELEIIIVDDGSKDATAYIVEELAGRDPRIKFYRNPKNLGIVETLNRALSYASGKFILRMDGDDISETDRVERKMKFLAENPQYDLVGCSLIGINEAGEILNRTFRLDDEELLRKTLKYRSPVSHIWLCKREVYEKLGGYRGLKGVEDYDFLLRMTTNGYRYTNIGDYYGYYVRIGREGNTISSMGLRQRKLHNYAYRLYEERLTKGADSHSEKHLEEAVYTHRMVAKLYSISSSWLQGAIESRAQGHYMRMAVCLVLASISPGQLSYLLSQMIYRLKVQKKGKDR